MWAEIFGRRDSEEGVRQQAGSAKSEDKPPRARLACFEERPPKLLNQHSYTKAKVSSVTEALSMTYE